MKNIQTKINLIIFVLVIFLSGCINSDKNNYVLKIGTFNYTYEQYRILFNKNFKQQLKENKKIPKKAILNWQNQMIDNSLILADARKINLEEDIEINKQVDEMACQIITQSNGLLFERCVSDKIEITSEMLDDAIDKLKYLYTIEELQFRNEETFLNYTNSLGYLNSIEQFRDLVLKSENISGIEHGVKLWNWLSVGILEARDTLIKMDAGDITKPFYHSRGVSIYYIKEKDLNPNWDYLKSDKKTIIPTLKSVNTQIFAGQLDASLYKKANIKLFYENIHPLWLIIREDEHARLNAERYKDIADKVIMTYNDKGQEVSVKVINFINTYNNLMMRQVISSEDVLIYYLKDIPWKKQAMLMADELKVTSEFGFLTEKEDYRNRLIVDKYLKMKNKKLQNIDDKDLLDEYIRTKEKYNKGENIIVSLFFFNSEEEAYNARTVILSGEWMRDSSSVSKFQGLKDYAFHRTIHFQSSDFDKFILTRLFDAENGSVEPVIQPDRNIFLMVYKEKLLGERYILFEEVSNSIKNSLYSRRLLETKKVLVDSLKKEYKIIENFPEI